MNTPNKLTLLRIFLVVPTLALLIVAKCLKADIDYTKMNSATIAFMVAGVIFVLAMLTDFVDGYIARKYKQITTFGKLFDPLADKIMTTTTMIMFSVMGIIPIYFTIVFVVRDTIVDGSRNVAAANKVEIAASWWGKWKTTIQSFGLVIIFFVFPVSVFSGVDPIKPSWELWALNIPIIVATFLSVVSGVLYFKRVTPFLKTNNK